MPTGRYERKLLPLAQAQVKAESDDGVVRVDGYGSTFGGEPDSYGDVIAPGAYADTIRDWAASGHNLPMLFNHDTDKAIGMWPRLAEDARGLRLDGGELTPGHSIAADVAASLKHRAISGLSIGFRTVGSEDRDDGTRLLTKIKLYEVSVVTMPANANARVDAVKQVEGIVSIRDFQDFLREHGFSRRKAEAIAREGWKAADARDEPGAEPRSNDARDERGGSLTAVSAIVDAVLRDIRIGHPS